MKVSAPLIFSKQKTSGFNPENFLGNILNRIIRAVQRFFDYCGRYEIIGNITGALRTAKGILTLLVAAAAALFFGLKDRDLTITRDATASALANTIQGLIEVIPLGCFFTAVYFQSNCSLKDRLHGCLDADKIITLYNEQFNSFAPVRPENLLKPNFPINQANLGQQLRRIIHQFFPPKRTSS